LKPCYYYYILEVEYYSNCIGGRSGFDGRAEAKVACTGCRWPVKKRLLYNR